MTTIPTSRTADSWVILRRLWTGWVHRYLGRLLLAFGLMAVVAGSASAYPLLTRYIFNALADGRADEVIWMAPPAIILLALVKGVALFAQTVQVNALALRATTDLQTLAFHQPSSLEYRRGMATKDLKEALSERDQAFGDYRES